MDLISKIKQEIITYRDNTITQLQQLDIDALATMIRLFEEAQNRDAQIFIMGNGGSGATASHMCCDFNKGLSYQYPRKYRMHCLNDNIPTILAYANDVGYDAVFVEQIKNFLNKEDLVIGISGSGNSPNVIKALQYANELGATTLGISGYNGGELKHIAQYNVHINCNDMQHVEDIHTFCAHMAMRVLHILHT